MGALLVILAVINWCIYHKIFQVYYFGSMRKSITNEIIWALIAAMVELAIIMTVGSIVVPILIVIGIIALIILSIRKATNNLDKKSNVKMDEVSETDSSNGVKGDFVTENNKEIVSEKIQQKEIEEQGDFTDDKSVPIKSETIFCPFCGKKILRTAKFCNFCGNKNNYTGETV